MIKKILTTCVCVIVVFVLQSTLFSKVNIGGIIPNLLIVITACFGFMEGDIFGLLVGFACGVLMDVFYGPFMGFYAVIYMYLGYFNGKFCNLFFPEDIKLPLALITGTDLLYGLTCYVFLFLLRGRFDFGYYFGHIIFPEVIETLLFSIVLYHIILKLYKSFMVEKK